MNRILLFGLLTALGVSLWFQWQVPRGAPAEGLDKGRGSGAARGGATSDRAAGPAAGLAAGTEAMDFSGTALSDEAWHLEVPGVEEKIPQGLPTPEGVEGGAAKVPPPLEIREVGAGIRLEVGEPGIRE